jgi:polysaccharide pyruvyl transferase WcaK-like protein
MKILLGGGYDTKNLGDHASLEVFQRDLRTIDPSTEIVLLSRHPDKKFDKTYNVRSILNLDHKNNEASLGRWFNGLNEGDNTTHLKGIIKELNTTDLLVIGNGRLFVDISLDFMEGPLSYYVILVTLAKFMGIPIMIFSMTIVPIKTEIGRTLLKYILSNSDVITVREEPSRKEVLKYGISDNKIIVVPDAAFGLNNTDRKEQGIRILKNEMINFYKNKFIGVNFRHFHLDTTTDGDYYLNLAILCETLHNKLGRNILMIPQMTYNVDNHLEDDREVYKLIYENITNKNNIHILKGEYNLFDTLAVYQCCEIVYSMRRHGLILSATQNIPIFGLTGEQNTSYVLNTLNIEDCNENIKKIMDSKNFSSLIDGFHKKEATMEIIKEKVMGYNKKTKKYSEIAFSLIS